MVCCNGDVFRDMILLGQHMGMEPGEYTFIFYISQPGSPIVGNFSWERGDDLDSVRESFHPAYIDRIIQCQSLQMSSKLDLEVHLLKPPPHTPPPVQTPD